MLHNMCAGGMRKVRSKFFCHQVGMGERGAVVGESFWGGVSCGNTLGSGATGGPMAPRRPHRVRAQRRDAATCIISLLRTYDL